MKVVSALILSVFALVFSGCTPKEGSLPKQDEQAEELSEALQEIPGVCMLDGLSFWVKVKTTVKDSLGNETEKMVIDSRLGGFKGNFGLGEQVLILGEETGWSGNKERLFYHVRISDGKEYWVFKTYIVPQAAPAVLTQEAKRYDRATKIASTKGSYEWEFHPLTLIAVANEEEVNGWLHYFAKVDKYVIKDFWIPKERVSFDQKDVEFGSRTTVALAEWRKKQEEKKNLLDKVEDAKSNEEITELKNKILKIDENLDEIRNDTVNAVEEILADSDYQSSPMFGYLQEELERIKTPDENETNINALFDNG